MLDDRTAENRSEESPNTAIAAYSKQLSAIGKNYQSRKRKAEGRKPR